MSAVARVRIAALGVCAAAFCSAGVSSCGATGGSSVTASGTTLSVYVSVPAGGGDTAAKDVLDAEQLAFQQQGSATIGKFRLKLVKVQKGELSENARTAIQDTGAVAYIGELAPGDSAQSVGITNAQDLLQVSPTDTALELTQSTPAISNTPNRYYESLKTYGRTFARVVPSTALEAKAQVQEMKTLGVSKLFVAGDGSPYGLALTSAIRTAAAQSAISVSGGAAGADGMFYAGRSATAAAPAIAHAQASDPSLKVFVPSALDTQAFAAAASGSVFASAPGFMPKDLSTQAQQFVSQFKSSYGHEPATQAIFGYEAMSAVLAVLREAGSSANDRATVVKDFFAIRNRASALGTYSISSDGDTSLGSFVFSRLRAHALSAFKSVQVQG
jgi:ABC-type branched-subunit amino acid transport system substrate-binding protein